MPKKLATKIAIRLLRHAILARSAKLNLVSLNHSKTPDGSCRMFIDWNFLCGDFSLFASYNAIIGLMPSRPGKCTGCAKILPALSYEKNKDIAIKLSLKKSSRIKFIHRS